MNDKIGTYNADGSIKSYPATSLKGSAYDSQQDRLGIGNGQFVILDRGMTADERTILVSELLASPKAPSKTVTKAEVSSNEP